MTNQQILKKAIEKAVKNEPNFQHFMNKVWYEPEKMIRDGAYLVLIFSHDFAKAFWGEEEWMNSSYGGARKIKEGWQYHLQKMVLLSDEEKFKYLEKFL